MEWAAGIEPAALAWEARVLPLYDAHKYFSLAQNLNVTIMRISHIQHETHH